MNEQGTIAGVTMGLKEAADGFKKMQMALLAFAGICTVLLIVVVIKISK